MRFRPQSIGVFENVNTSAVRPQSVILVSTNSECVALCNAFPNSSFSDPSEGEADPQHPITGSLVSKLHRYSLLSCLDKAPDCKTIVRQTSTRPVALHFPGQRSILLKIPCGCAEQKRMQSLSVRCHHRIDSTLQGVPIHRNCCSKIIKSSASIAVIFCSSAHPLCVRVYT